MDPSRTASLALSGAVLLSAVATARDGSPAASTAADADRIEVVERGEGLYTLRVGAARAADAPAFAARSWLAALPEESPTPRLETARDGECLEAELDGTALELCLLAAAHRRVEVELYHDAERIYGLGQRFERPGETVVDRIGTMREGRNAMVPFNGGANGDTLYPIAYFDADAPFALLLDSRHPQRWHLDEDRVELSAAGDELRLHVIVGATLAEVRRRYMRLAGHPPVPPKAAFGLWLSEYGFDGWDELDDKLRTMAERRMPISAVVLDLQWFGGVRPYSPSSPMGSLSWDLERFPAPAEKIRRLAERGLATVLIEEPYISAGLDAFDELARLGHLPRDAAGEPAMTSRDGHWWGYGGMVDFLSPEAGAHWHDARRAPLIDAGVAAHWTDLGEPESYDPAALYADGLPHELVHNSYNLEWTRSVVEGYARTHPERRPFTLSRSGGIGSQALGAALWSGDVASDFASLAAQMPQQTHMMWSGQDYYGSDVGGFRREALRVPPGMDRDEAMDRLYTQWLAYAALFEVPVRPHAENLCNCVETAPDRIGDLPSNRASLELRYELLPYYYALAHRAWRDGEPVFPSLDYVHPHDPRARGLGHVKMIGPDLLGAAVADASAESVSLYLPAGTWFDYRSGAALRSTGETVTRTLRSDGVFRLPLFARDGAIVPRAVGDGTGLRVHGLGDGRFDWYDDDGESAAYREGEYRHARVEKRGRRVRIVPVRGAPPSIERLEWALEDPRAVAAVAVDGVEVPFGRTATRIELALPPGAGERSVELR